MIVIDVTDVVVTAAYECGDVIGTYTHAHLHIHRHIHTPAHKCTHTDTPTPIHTHTYTHRHTPTHTYTHLHTHTHTPAQRERERERNTHTHTHMLHKIGAAFTKTNYVEFQLQYFKSRVFILNKYIYTEMTDSHYILNLYK